jgi:hypothetical protein
MVLKSPISKGILGALFAFFAIVGVSNTLAGKCTSALGCIFMVLVLGGFAFWLLYDAHAQYRGLQRRAGELKR